MKLVTEIIATVRPGHVVSGTWRVGDPLRPWAYSCSCGEITASAAAEVQQHVDDLRSPAVAAR